MKQPAARVPWLGLAALISGQLLAWITRYGTAVILPGLRADFGADEAALGALGAAYFWPFALIQPVAGLLADWWGPRRSLVLWLTIAGAGTVLFAVAPVYPLALVGRALCGAGVGIVLVCAFSALGEWFDPKRFGTVSGLYTATGPLGGLLATWPLAALVDGLGWRLAWGLIAALLFATALSAALFIPEVARRNWAEARPATSGVTAWAGLRRALRLRNVWLTGAYAFVALGILSSMQGLWTVPFLQDVYHLEAAQAAGVLQAWSIGMLVALPAWGYLVDRVTHTHKWTIVASIILHSLPWIVLAVAPGGWPPAGLFALFLYLAATNGCWMPAYALVRATAPPAIVGTALGLFNFAFFFGAAVYQQITGLVLAHLTARGTGSPGDAYQLVFGLFVVSLALAALAVAAIRERPVEAST